MSVVAERGRVQVERDPVGAGVRARLAEFLDAEAAVLARLDPDLGAFADTVRQVVLVGGKRLRSTFAYWGWRGVVGGLAEVERVLPALAAMELMHTFALVHDDVMDRSATRRGRPTAHRVFAAQHAGRGRRGDPGRFGESAAVLAGDLCLVWADQLLATARVSGGTLRAARACYDRMRVEAVAGQYLDVLGEAEPGRWDAGRALLVARLKTASYTVRRPLQFGAALAGGVHPAAGRAYRRYGMAVGEAFQLRDDLLGAYGDPAVTGKPAGDDLRTGKPTTLAMLARELARPGQRAELDRAGAEPERLGAVIRETGAVERIELMIERRVAAAVGAVRGAPIDAAARAALTDLAVAAAQRAA
jgi:geranylgeranyl diphosphate synthase, type I